MDVLSPFFRLQSSSCLETSYYGAYRNPNQLAGDLISHIRRIRKIQTLLLVLSDLCEYMLQKLWSVWVGIAKCSLQLLPEPPGFAKNTLVNGSERGHTTSETNSQIYKPSLGEGGRMGWCLT